MIAFNDEIGRAEPPAPEPRRWVVWARPSGGRLDHAREYREGDSGAADSGICARTPERWTRTTGRLERPRHGACSHCDAELERLRLIHGDDYLVPPADVVQARKDLEAGI
jgi:hypothetical protein